MKYVYPALAAFFVFVSMLFLTWMLVLSHLNRANAEEFDYVTSIQQEIDTVCKRKMEYPAFAHDEQVAVHLAAVVLARNGVHTPALQGALEKMSSGKYRYFFADMQAFCQDGKFEDALIEYVGKDNIAVMEYIYQGGAIHVLFKMKTNEKGA